jgi:hypothetical protein
MESFEHLVKVALESENLIVATNLKFHVKRRTRKASVKEEQTHGYEVDLVGAKNRRLVLASVKSYFGSTGVNRQGFKNIAKDGRQTYFDNYKLFNYKDIREGVIAKAASQFGYSTNQVELRLYVGHFQNDEEQQEVTKHLRTIKAGRGPIKVVGLLEIVEAALGVANSATYINDPVVMTLKALKKAAQAKGLSVEQLAIL